MADKSKGGFVIDVMFWFFFYYYYLHSCTDSLELFIPSCCSCFPPRPPSHFQPPGACTVSSKVIKRRKEMPNIYLGPKLLIPEILSSRWLLLWKFFFSNKSSFVGKLMEVYRKNWSLLLVSLFFFFLYAQCSEVCFDNVKWGAKTSVRFIYNNNINFVCEILVPF